MEIKGERNDQGLYEINVKDKEFKFPSVTTILGIMPNPELDELKKDIGDEKQFNNITRKAGNRGNVMHLYLENLSKGFLKGFSKKDALIFSQKKTINEVESKYSTEEIDKGMDLFYNIFYSSFLDELKKPLFLESLLVSFKHGYAGRTDIIYANTSNEIILGDYKSSSSIVLKDSTKYKKYKLQLAAYINAFEELTKKEIKEGVVWVGHPSGYQKIILSKEEYPKYLEYFLKLKDKYKKSSQ